jgi:hypothetical protein
MLFALLAAMALAHLLDASRRRQRWAWLGAATAVILFELLPAPRPTYSARIPEVYRVIAKDPRDIRVLTLPFGFRSGEWSRGNFTAASQYYQTFHQKGVIGGYLSRIGQQEIARQRESVNVSRLIELSEGRHVSAKDIEVASQRAAGFVDRARLGYIVVDTERTSPALLDYAIRVFRLRKIAGADGFDLYVPTVGTIASGGPLASVRTPIEQACPICVS